MKISKNQWIVIGVIGAIAIWYFFLRKKDDVKESGYESVKPCTTPCYCDSTNTLKRCDCCGAESVRKRRTNVTA